MQWLVEKQSLSSGYVSAEWYLDQGLEGYVIEQKQKCFHS